MTHPFQTASDVRKSCPKCGQTVLTSSDNPKGYCNSHLQEARVAPYGRNRNGVPNRPNEPCVITIQCTNKRMAEGWAAFIRSQQHMLDALPLAIVKVEDWPE